VASTTVTNVSTLFSTNKHFIDFHVPVPTVQPEDPWSDQNIGVQFLSTVSLFNPDLWGGYWDLDHVRLSSFAAPNLTELTWADGQFSFNLQSEPGTQFDILASTDVGLPMSEWTNLGTVTNETGTTQFVDSEASVNRRFYRARQLP
jgi:hypothetical protein